MLDIKEILKRLKEIEERVAKATPGPWKWVLDDDPINFCAEELVDPEGKPVIGVDEYLIDISPDDAEFITHAREDVPWLCETVRQLVARLEEVEAQNAAMRRALERVIEVGVGEMDAPFSHMTSADCALCEEKDEIAEAALKKNDAGRALLNRLRKLEAVAEAARMIREPLTRDYTGAYSRPDEMLDTTDMKVCVLCERPIDPYRGYNHADDCPWKRLKQALAALEEEK